MNPTPVPPSLPPLLRDQRKVDAEHLKLLAVFHYVFAGLAVAGLGFLFLHWGMMQMVMSMPPQDGQPAPPPAEFFALFKWFYFAMGTFIICAGLANAVSARLIQQRRGRMVSFVVAGLNCLAFPFGTTLGVFTFVVLLRDSVAELYAPLPAAAAAR